eukprot:350699-Chlamydomonas_euryale.AAC.1
MTLHGVGGEAQHGVGGEAQHDVAWRCMMWPEVSGEAQHGIGACVCSKVLLRAYPGRLVFAAKCCCVRTPAGLCLLQSVAACTLWEDCVCSRLVLQWTSPKPAVTVKTALGSCPHTRDPHFPPPRSTARRTRKDAADLELGVDAPPPGQAVEAAMKRVGLHFWYYLRHLWEARREAFDR